MARFHERLRERARHYLRDPSRRRIEGVRPQRRDVDVYPAHRARTRESASEHGGAAKRNCAEGAERGAARNLECGHRNLRMRDQDSARGKPPPVISAVCRTLGSSPPCGGSLTKRTARGAFAKRGPWRVIRVLCEADNKT